MKNWIIFLILALSAGFVSAKGQYCKLPETKRSLDAKARHLSNLQEAFEKKGFELGAPLFIRIFKENRELELWVQTGKKFELFKTYPICAMSGFIGPKMKKGDKQAPEGFYMLSAEGLNPSSAYHLSVNVGYPNLFDRGMSATGSHIMIHGNCCSVGCFAMTDPIMEEIYTLIHCSFEKGHKEIPIHIFPFHLTQKNLEERKDGSWYYFWAMLQEGYLAFETTKKVPNVKLKNKLYHFAQVP